MLNHSHSFDWTNVKILDTEDNYYKRLVSEMLHIKEQSNGLNNTKRHRIAWQFIFWSPWYAFQDLDSPLKGHIVYIKPYSSCE